MAKSGSDKQPDAKENRVDPAHRLGAVPEEGVRAIPAEALAAALTEEEKMELVGGDIAWNEGGVALVGQIREQATQLARHLQSQQQNLDRREAELNAREAALENEVRSARLWLTSRQAELEDQAKELAAQSTEIIEAEEVLPAEDEGPTTLKLHIDEDAASYNADSKDTAGTGVRFKQEKQVLHDLQQQLSLKEQELGHREKKITKSEQDLEKRALELAGKERELETIAEDLQRRETLLAQQQGRTETQKAEFEKRHREMDQRQAMLYRDIEEHTQLRTRLGSDQHALEELRADIAQRREEFEQQRLMIERQRAECEELRVQTNADLDRQRAECDELRKQAAAELELQQEQAQDLQVREEALQQRHVEIQTAIRRFERMGAVEERMHELDEMANAFQARRRYLDDAETLLKQQEEELQAERERLEAEQEEKEEALRRERNKMIDEQKRASLDYSRQREALQRRVEQVDSREATLEQMRAEVNRTQREALETRLATEELWAQMSGPLAPASLARSLAQVRAKLADHYRLTDRDLNERRRELEALRHSLDEKHSQLQKRWEEMENWAEGQRQAVEDQAARLVAREQELDRQQTYFEELELRWQEERHGYRQDIRQLLAKIRTFSPAAGTDCEPHAAVA